MMLRIGNKAVKWSNQFRTEWESCQPAMIWPLPFYSWGLKWEWHSSAVTLTTVLAEVPESQIFPPSLSLQKFIFFYTHEDGSYQENRKQQVLVRMQRNRNRYALLLVIENGIASMENSVKVPHRTPLWFSNLTSGHISKAVQNSISKRYLYTNVHCSIVYSSQEVEATQMPIDR